MHVKNWWKVAVVVVVLVAVVAVAQTKTGNAGGPAAPVAAEAVPPLPAPGTVAAPAPSTGALPASGPEPAPAAAAPAVAPRQPSPPESAPSARPAAPGGQSSAAGLSVKPATSSAVEKPKSLPRMLDLGSVTCVPCKMMVPVMDALKQEYAGKLTVEFINVNEDPASAEKYQIQSIPTQILFDTTGKEVYRHIGFWPQEGIVAKLQALGLLAKEGS
jgi:thioredoxin 1